jgi:hypothetical protein
VVGGNERTGRGGESVAIGGRETSGLTGGQACTSDVLSLETSAAGKGTFRSTNSWSAVSVGTLCISCRTGPVSTTQQPERRPYLLVFPMPPPDINANCSNQQTDTC